jgi:hypothetical protein
MEDAMEMGDRRGARMRESVMGESVGDAVEEI